VLRTCSCSFANSFYAFKIGEVVISAYPYQVLQDAMGLSFNCFFILAKRFSIYFSMILRLSF
jgi:hypothetical protein